MDFMPSKKKALFKNPIFSTLSFLFFCISKDSFDFFLQRSVLPLSKYLWLCELCERRAKVEMNQLTTVAYQGFVDIKEKKFSVFSVALTEMS